MKIITCDNLCPEEFKCLLHKSEHIIMGCTGDVSVHKRCPPDDGCVKNANPQEEEFITP